MSLELSDLPGLGTTSLADLAKLGILTPFDLLMHYPLRYEDFSLKKNAVDVQTGETVTVEGVMTSIASRVTPRRRMTLVEGVFTDETGSIKVMWFNQRYLIKTLGPGTRVRLSGKVEVGPRGRQITNPSYEILRAAEAVHTGRIVPIYSLTGSLTQKRLRSAIDQARRAVPIHDWLPESTKQAEGLVDLPQAIQQVHFPDTHEALDTARRRLSFDELFLYELTHLKSRAELKTLRAPSVPADIEQIKEFVASLPFDLTSAQRKAAWQIVQDMEKAEPMNRLLEGDVGSGKTVVAALAALSAARSGYQTAVLAPTEILAEQHEKSFVTCLGDHARIGLVTRTHGKDLLEEVENGDIQIIVGTHALLQQGVHFEKLGLVIVDEQHRFGVRQRQALQEKEREDVGVPHLLSMTATPIPRTLALTLYGDLDISVLDEMPKGRKPIKTEIVKRNGEEEVFAKIRSELDAGRQVFVVCPLIDPSDEFGARSVQELSKELSDGPLKSYRLAMLHGKMKAKEKEAIMSAFAKHELDVLVSTTVIEVGVNVPNATVMYVEGAERFGLAQLHQLRGRVGRSDLPSFCFLHPSGFVPEKTYERLRALVECQNGFELAERDLALRGPGDVYGDEQSGFLGFKLANIFDALLVAKARNAAADLLKEDPGLGQYPAVHARLEEYARRVHFE